MLGELYICQILTSLMTIVRVPQEEGWGTKLGSYSSSAVLRKSAKNIHLREDTGNSVKHEIKFDNIISGIECPR